MDASADSVILIDHLNGVLAAGEALSRYETVFVSIGAWIEVMAGAVSSKQVQAARLLAGFEVVELDLEIAVATAELRRSSRLKIPDAVILATARRLNVPLLTRNTKDFDPLDPSVIVPYVL